MNEYALNTMVNDIAAEIAVRTMQACHQIFRNDVNRAYAECDRARDLAWDFIEAHPENAINWDLLAEVCF